MLTREEYDDFYKKIYSLWVKIGNEEEFPKDYLHALVKRSDVIGVLGEFLEKETL